MVVGVIIWVVFVVVYIGWMRWVFCVLGVFFLEVRFGVKVVLVMVVVWVVIFGVVVCVGVVLMRGIFVMMMEIFFEVMFWVVVVLMMVFVWVEVFEVVVYVMFWGFIFVLVVSFVFILVMWIVLMVVVFGVVFMLVMVWVFVLVLMVWIVVYDGIGFVIGYGNRVVVFDVVVIMVIFRRWRWRVVLSMRLVDWGFYLFVLMWDVVLLGICCFCCCVFFCFRSNSFSGIRWWFFGSSILWLN